VQRTSYLKSRANFLQCNTKLGRGRRLQPSVADAWRIIRIDTAALLSAI
jgi:hypothetical protein